MLTPNLFRVFVLWAMLYMSLTATAKAGMGQKDLIEGRVAPSAIIGELPPTSLQWTRAGKLFPPKVLKTVLKDQLGIDEPEVGPVYVFLNFWHGTWYENVFNGGSHATIIYASWGGGDEAMTFQAQRHDLALDRCSGDTFHKKRVFDSEMARMSLTKNGRFRALGKAQTKRNFEELIRLVNKDSKAYFDKNKDYNYLFNNCGDYVQAMADLTSPEHGKLEVPLAPPMRLV